MQRAPVTFPHEAQLLHLVPRARRKHDVTAEVVHSLEREHRDYVASLRALVALLRRSAEETGDAVLGRILESEVHQLAVLGGEMTTLLRLDTGDVERPGRVELSRVLEGAARRSGRPALVRLTGPLRVTGHRSVMGQIVSSVLAYADRIAEGTVIATAETKRGRAVIVVRAPVSDDRKHGRGNGRLTLLHSLARAEGGHLRIERRRDEVRMRLSFPLA